MGDRRVSRRKTPLTGAEIDAALRRGFEHLFARPWTVTEETRARGELVTWDGNVCNYNLAKIRATPEAAPTHPWYAEDVQQIGSDGFIGTGPGVPFRSFDTLAQGVRVFLQTVFPSLERKSRAKVIELGNFRTARRTLRRRIANPFALLPKKRSPADHAKPPKDPE
jgi:hypothetical protein